MYSRLSLIVPVYNEEQAIPQTFSRLRDLGEELIHRSMVNQVELIFVDDGSQDRSAVLLQELASHLSSQALTADIIQFSRNFGHSSAVFAGLEHSTGDIVGIIDADLQDPPECLIDMIQLLQSESADVVYGQRNHRMGESYLKKWTAWIFYRLLNSVSGVPVPKDTGDFRVMTREVCDAVVALNEKEPFLRGLVAWVGYKQLPFLYSRHPRSLGETKYPMKKMVRFAVQAVLSFSAMPLRVAIYVGAIGILFSAAFSLHALRVWLNGEALPGYASIVIGFSFGQSVTLFLIGIVGLYLGRVHMAIQDRPRYIIRKPRRKTKPALARVPGHSRLDNLP